MIRLIRVSNAALLMATIVVAGSALGVSADGSVAAVKRPAGAVKLTGASQISVGAVRCGKLRGPWLPGTKLAGGYFITHAQQATNSNKLASRSKGKTRAKHLRWAAKFRGKARAQQATCRTPTPPAPVASCATGGVCVVGSTGPGGGKVFYASAAPFTVTGASCATACRYIEVAPAGWYPGGPTDPELRWGGFGEDGLSCSEKNIPGSATVIGSGAANTAAILAACPATSGPNSAPAAYAAFAYAPTVNGGRLTGWFLPSLYELNALDISGVGDLKYGADFWSSSQGRTEFNAWYQRVGQHTPNVIYKDARNTFVRPVRSFG